jgi:pyocin large subunit-like protein
MTDNFVQELAERIAKGHSYTKHGHEFGISTSEELQKIVASIIKNPTEKKNLSCDRKAYWDSSNGAIVILNPKSSDGGTIFKPSRGKLYFDNLA